MITIKSKKIAKKIILRLPYRNDAEIAKSDGLLAELQAKTSKGCRILLFQHHSYMVTLRTLSLLPKYSLKALCVKPHTTEM